MKGDIERLLAVAASVELATLVQRVPAPASYVYELKLDGYRMLGVKLGADVRIVSRRRQDWTRELAPIARAVAELRARELVIDGEVCALDESGRPSFELLQNRARGVNLAYVVFDLLWLDGADLRGEPFERRRSALAELIERGRPERIALSPLLEGDPEQLLASARASGIEGIVAKRKGSTYAGGRAGSWLKLKCTKRQEFAVVGYLPLLGKLDAVGSLLLALKEADGRLHFSGKVGTGFDDATRRALAKRLDAHASDEATAVGVPRFGGIVRWSEPRDVVEVEFTEWTSEGYVRHPSYRGLRPDKTPDECVREMPQPVPPVHTATDEAKRDGAPVIAGIRLSHPDRVLDPAGVTKRALAEYYVSVGEWMVPHVRGRPLTLLRWAEGKPTEKGGVYLRHKRAWGPNVLRRVRIREKTKTGEYLVADDVVGLVALAQMDVLEIHTWNSLADDVEHPNRIVLDLDPDPSVDWARVVEAARLLRAMLREAGLESFVKTTGGKGLHVVVPLVPDALWSDCFAFARGVAETLARAMPNAFTTTMAKAKRGGKIYVDYLRNNRTNTSVAAYSIRARPGAPVSVPLGWEELDGAAPERFTIATVPARLTTLARDPWATYFTARQKLPTHLAGPSRA